MMEQTGCDGVVVGRGCLGRPWLFADLAAAFAGSPSRVTPTLGEVAAAMRRHATYLVEMYAREELLGCRDLRKHIAWYLRASQPGRPCGPSSPWSTPGPPRRAARTARPERAMARADAEGPRGGPGRRRRSRFQRAGRLAGADRGAAGPRRPGRAVGLRRLTSHRHAADAASPRAAGGQAAVALAAGGHRGGPVRWAPWRGSGTEVRAVRCPEPAPQLGGPGRGRR